MQDCERRKLLFGMFPTHHHVTSENTSPLFLTHYHYKYWNIYYSNVKAGRFPEMIDERSSSSILRKTIFEPQTGIELPTSDDRWDSGVGSRGATGAAAPLTFYLGGPQYRSTPLKNRYSNTL